MVGFLLFKSALSINNNKKKKKNRVFLVNFQIPSATTTNSSFPIPLFKRRGHLFLSHKFEGIPPPPPPPRVFRSFNASFIAIIVNGIVAAPRISRAMSGMANCSYEIEQMKGGETLVEQHQLLPAVNDDHDGVIAELTEPLQPDLFASMLRASIAQWRLQGKKGIWIKVPTELVNLVEVAVKEGFWYHHAEPKYLMLAYWIPEGAHTLPANASHCVRIGAFVMNAKNEVLVVQEKSGILRGTGIWKFPTGVVDEGEDICVTAVREVKEETGIDTEFVQVLAFRQSHRSFFEKSDLLFVCMMRPLSFDIQKQETEIEAAEWMPWEEFSAQPYNQEDEFSKHILRLCIAKKDETYSGFSPVPTTSSSDKMRYLYLNSRDLKQN